MIDEDLWNRVDIAINQARTRQETISELNRLLQKWNVGAPASYISEHSSAIRREWLTPQQMEQLFIRGHTRTNVRRFDSPLVAVEYDGKTYMLDGTNRINIWLKEGNTEQHEVIILGPKRISTTTNNAIEADRE
jgi:hypothetical protein